MEEIYIIDTIDDVIEALSNEHIFYEQLYNLGVEDNPYLNEVENYLTNIAWKAITRGRDIPEINQSEFECFTEVLRDLAFNNKTSFNWDGMIYNFKNGEDIWLYFKGDHIEDFFDDDIKKLKNN